MKERRGNAVPFQLLLYSKFCKLDDEVSGPSISTSCVFGSFADAGRGRSRRREAPVLIVAVAVAVAVL
jgi:hypothetical protein